MRVRFKGNRPFHRDRFFSGMVFYGKGDIQIVADAAGERMTSSYPELYEAVDEDAPPTAPAPPPPPPAEPGGDDELTDEDRRDAADRARILATYQLQDGDKKVALQDAHFNAIREHVADDLHMKLRTPSREDLYEAVVEFVRTKEAVERAKAGAGTDPAE